MKALSDGETFAKSLNFGLNLNFWIAQIFFIRYARVSKKRVSKIFAVFSIQFNRHLFFLGGDVVLFKVIQSKIASLCAKYIALLIIKNICIKRLDKKLIDSSSRG